MIRFARGTRGPALCAAAAALIAVSAPACSPPEPLEDYGPVPPFELVERSGRPVGLDDLSGKVWIADFIFTRCAGVCLTMTSRMADLQTALAGTDDCLLVSFTVDPGYDTPEVLARYAEDHGANERRWLFLTGDAREIQDLATKGFHLAIEAPEEGVEEDTGRVPGITHSQRFVLVDRRGRIRGYYDGADAEAVGRLAADASALSARGA